jgi:hypothetical protein
VLNQHFDDDDDGLVVDVDGDDDDDYDDDDDVLAAFHMATKSLALIWGKMYIKTSGISLISLRHRRNSKNVSM